MNKHTSALMKSKPVNISFYLLMMLLVFTQCGPSKNKSAGTDSSKVVFFDDFSGNGLDRTKWNVYLTGQVFNNEQQAYVDSTVTIYTTKGKDAEGAKNGALVIHPRYTAAFETKEGKKFDFISGRINTRGKLEFAYGKVSARIKLSEGTGLWPAWWILGTGGWPETGEIDIMEFIGEKDWTNAALHGPGYSGNTPFVKRVSFTDKDPITNWHIYAVDWTPDSLSFSVDGKTFYTVTKPEIEKYGRWSYDSPKFLILNFALGGGYPGGVNKIKEPYFGIPASTVDLVKQGKCRMLVDWVEVKQNKQ